MRTDMNESRGIEGHELRLQEAAAARHARARVTCAGNFPAMTRTYTPLALPAEACFTSPRNRLPCVNHRRRRRLRPPHPPHPPFLFTPLPKNLFIIIDIPSPPAPAARVRTEELRGQYVCERDVGPPLEA